MGWHRPTWHPCRLATAGVDAVFLADVGRRLIRSGDALYVIEVGPTGAMLLPASQWDVHGSYDPCDLALPGDAGRPRYDDDTHR